MKILVVSSKGGVGKSTVAMQVAAPYLFMKNRLKPILFYEFDDENIDSLSYGGSSLTLRKPIDIDELVIVDAFLDILAADAHCCIDVGGNKSTTLCLDALEDCGAGGAIDMAIIPLLDGEQDALNAKTVYDRLRAISREMVIVFALNRVRNVKHVKYQFDYYFGDVRGIFSDDNAIVRHILPGEKDRYLCIEDSDIIKLSRKFGVTIYEIAVQSRDFVSEIYTENDEKKKKLLGFKHYVYQNAKKYYFQTLTPCFDRLDTFAGRNSIENTAG